MTLHSSVVTLDRSGRIKVRRTDVMRRGMAESIGRLRACPILHSTCVALRHNTIRGAAGGSLLNAELCVKKGVESIESA